MKTKKVKSISKLKKEADRVFSLWIRERDGGTCFTCGKKDDPKYMQAGHFISRSHNVLRFDERNVACQCVGCNIFKSGNMSEYAERLMKKHGAGIIATLNKEKWKTKQWKPQELEEIIKRYS